MNTMKTIKEGVNIMSHPLKTTVQKNTFSAADIASYLGISLVGAYNLLQSQEFPSFRIGRRILVTRENFDEWLQKQQKNAKNG